MGIVSENTIKTLYGKLRQEVESVGGLDFVSTEFVRNMLFSDISVNDYIPSELVKPVLKLVSLSYDKNGQGYHGVMVESEKRVTEYAKQKGKVLFSEFFLHTNKQKDMYIMVNGKRRALELKTGCGNWLYSPKHDLMKTIQNYSRRTEIINWCYTFVVDTKKAGKELYSFDIMTEWKTLFAFLRDFNGDITTWFKENARSGEKGIYIYEMQTIKTSKKKADYLLTFDNWIKERG